MKVCSIQKAVLAFCPLTKRVPGRARGNREAGRRKCEGAILSMGENQERYICRVCQYVYDPAAGDPSTGINPGVFFEDLPADWVCPVCGAVKAEFTEE